MKLVIFLLSWLVLKTVKADKSDVGLNPGAMIANHGYPSETHTVTTQDGYILTLYRIPFGVTNSSTPRPPVFLMHGFASCSAEFVALGPKFGLAYILADAGYDVWLGNARGTQFSRNHTTINVDQNPEEFFDFTWHEIGIYDVSSSIDYILQTTNNEQLHYIGHSQGTTVLLVLLSSQPEYNQKIKIASLMAPAAIVKHYPNIFIQEICKYVDTVWKLLQKYKIYEIPLVGSIRKIVVDSCRDYPEGSDNLICELIHDTILAKVDAEMVPIVSTNSPANAGLKQYVHYGQLVRDGGFRQFDNGAEENLKIYGTERPPDYDLAKISAPVALYYALNDGLITVEDENTLASMVPNLVNNYLVPDEKFEHNDFAMSNKVVELVYNELLSVMSKF